MDSLSAAQIFRTQILQLSGVTEDVQETKDETETKANTRKKKVESESEPNA